MKKQYKKFFFLFLHFNRKNCSDICITYNSQKFIREKNVCLDKYSIDSEYKYEYDNLCYKKCSNNKESTGNDFVCKIIYKNKKDTNDKINIQLTIMITVASIIIIAIIIILINYFRKKLISRIYNPLVDNHDLITLILTSVNQQINQTTNLRNTDIIKNNIQKKF